MLAKTLENTSFLVVRLSCRVSAFALTAAVAAVCLVRAVLSAEHSPVSTGSALKKRVLTPVLSLRILIHFVPLETILTAFDKAPSASTF